jgi:GNAT superfamily N-acetyltransferase
MARVHVETWKTTYRGLVPDNRLDALTVDSDIAGGFGSHLQHPPPGEAQFVALMPPGEVVGFAMGGPAREPEPDYTGELGAIYVLRSHQRRGVGSALVGEVARHLVRTGHTGMMVWVMEQSPYRRFYEHLGGTVHRRVEHPSRIAGGPVPTVSYVWVDIGPLARL